MGKNLYVGGLNYDTTESALKELFETVGGEGSVVKASIIMDRTNPDQLKSKGFAFVDMDTDAHAEEAITKFNNFEFEGRNLVVNEARPKENKSFGGGNNNRGGGSWN